MRKSVGKIDRIYLIERERERERERENKVCINWRRALVVNVYNDCSGVIVDANSVGLRRCVIHRFTACRLDNLAVMADKANRWERRPVVDSLQVSADAVVVAAAHRSLARVLAWCARFPSRPGWDGGDDLGFLLPSAALPGIADRAVRVQRSHVSRQTTRLRERSVAELAVVRSFARVCSHVVDEVKVTTKRPSTVLALERRAVVNLDKTVIRNKKNTHTKLNVLQ